MCRGNKLSRTVSEVIEWLEYVIMENLDDSSTLEIVRRDIEFALTGSCSLSMLGLIDRKPGDIDIVINCKTNSVRRIVRRTLGEFKKSYKQTVDADSFGDIFDFEHVVSLIYNSTIKIDCMVVTRDIKYCTMDADFLMLTPYETLKIKKTFTRNKFDVDVATMIGKILSLKTIKHSTEYFQ